MYASINTSKKKPFYVLEDYDKEHNDEEVAYIKKRAETMLAAIYAEMEAMW